MGRHGGRPSHELQSVFSWKEFHVAPTKAHLSRGAHSGSWDGSQSGMSLAPGRAHKHGPASQTPNTREPMPSAKMF